MAEAMRVRIVGVPELGARLRAWSARVDGGLMAAALAGAQPVVGLIQRKTPVLTGNLRRSVHAEPGTSTPVSATVLVGTDVIYAGFVEYGTSRMGAQPYLRPGIAEGRPIFLAECARALTRLARLR